MASVLVVRLGALGDVVHAMPVVAALRETWPEARIGWAVRAAYADLVRQVRGVSEVHAVRGRVDPAAVGAMRRQRYDVCLDLQGLVQSAAYARASGARRVIGFSRGLAREGLATLAYGETGGQGGGHVIAQNLSLLERLGLEPPVAPRIDLRVPASPAVVSTRVLLGDPEAPFALINPGAGWPNKRWPVERFGALARRMHDVHGLRTAVTWGPGEATLAAAVVRAAEGAAVMAPEAGLLDLLALAHAAAIVVAGDTGPLHLACAVGTPVVGLYGPTPPQRNGPWAPADRCVSRYADCQCVFKRACTADTWCLGTITVDEVADAVAERLRGKPHASRLRTEDRGPRSED